MRGSPLTNVVRFYLLTLILFFLFLRFPFSFIYLFLCGSICVPARQQPFHCEIEHRLGLNCFTSGPVSCRVRLDRGGYVPGETIGIWASVHNQSRVTIKRTKASLTEVSGRHPILLFCWLRGERNEQVFALGIFLLLTRPKRRRKKCVVSPIKGCKSTEMGDGRVESYWQREQGRSVSSRGRSRCSRVFHLGIAKGTESNQVGRHDIRERKQGGREREQSLCWLLLFTFECATPMEASR